MESTSHSRRVGIAPLTHTIESYRNARVSWAGCLSELVDNALSPEKGNAGSVSIEIQRSQVRVYDDGIGMDDVSRVVRPGDSRTWSGSLDIGLFGIGATQALLWMGCRSEVHTIHRDQYCRVYVDWDQLLRKRRSARWEAMVEELGHVELLDPHLLPYELRKTRRGTLLIASKRIEGRRTPHSNEIRRALERTYTPALKGGRHILLHSGAKQKAYVLEPLSPPTLAEPTKVEGSIKGKSFHGEVGVLEQTEARISGIWFGYQHRMIVRKTAADIPGLPSNVYGYIELGPEWRRSLSTFKDDIARDIEPLLEAVREQIAGVIEQGLRWNKDLKVEWLNSQLATTLFRKTGEQQGRIEVKGEGQEEQNRGSSAEQKSPGSNRVSESVSNLGDQPRDEDASATGLRIESDPGRDPFVWTEIGESRIVVSFDPNHPHFEKCLSEPLDCPAFYGAIGASFAATLARKELEQIIRVFPRLRGRLTEDELQRFAVIYDEFTRRTAEVKERPTMAQIERDLHE